MELEDTHTPYGVLTGDFKGIDITTTHAPEEEEAGAGTAAGGRTVVEVTQEFDPKDHAFAMDDQLFVFKSVIGDLFIKHGPGGLQETVTVQLNPGGTMIMWGYGSMPLGGGRILPGKSTQILRNTYSHVDGSLCFAVISAAGLEVNLEALSQKQYKHWHNGLRLILEEDTTKTFSRRERAYEEVDLSDQNSPKNDKKRGAVGWLKSFFSPKPKKSNAKNTPSALQLTKISGSFSINSTAGATDWDESACELDGVGFEELQDEETEQWSVR